MGETRHEVWRVAASCSNDGSSQSTEEVEVVAEVSMTVQALSDDERDRVKEVFAMLDKNDGKLSASGRRS